MPWSKTEGSASGGALDADTVLVHGLLSELATLTQQSRSYVRVAGAVQEAPLQHEDTGAPHFLQINNEHNFCAHTRKPSLWSESSMT